MVAVACMTIKNIIDNNVFPERTQIGFVTYDSEVHVYSLKPGLSSPKMIVIPDYDEDDDDDEDLPIPVIDF